MRRGALTVRNGSGPDEVAMTPPRLLAIKAGCILRWMDPALVWSDAALDAIEIARDGLSMRWSIDAAGPCRNGFCNHAVYYPPGTLCDLRRMMAMQSSTTVCRIECWTSDGAAAW